MANLAACGWRAALCIWFSRRARTMRCNYALQAGAATPVKTTTPASGGRKMLQSYPDCCNTYTVKAGDTLDSIAAAYGQPVNGAKIMQARTQIWPSQIQAIYSVSNHAGSVDAEVAFAMMQCMLSWRCKGQYFGPLPESAKWHAL